MNVTESVQRQFTKRIQSISSLIYLEKVAVINLEALEIRRLRIDLITCNKTLNSLTPLKWNEYFRLCIHPSSSRTPSATLLKLRKGSEISFSFFSNKSNDRRNRLPPAVRSTNSLMKVKELRWLYLKYNYIYTSVQSTAIVTFGSFIDIVNK